MEESPTSGPGVIHAAYLSGMTARDMAAASFLSPNLRADSGGADPSCRRMGGRRGPRSFSAFGPVRAATDYLWWVARTAGGVGPHFTSSTSQRACLSRPRSEANFSCGSYLDLVGSIASIRTSRSGR